MTKEELSQLFYLNKEIERDRARLISLRERATATTPAYCRISASASNNFDCKIARSAEEIADIEAMISKRIELCWFERKRLENYISTITQSYIRELFKLRFCELKTWNQIADEIGGNNTEDSVRKTVERYIERHG